MVWVSPNSYAKLTSGSPAPPNNVTTLPAATILQPGTQALLQWYVNNGGRLFVDSPDLPIGMMNNGGANNFFMNSVLGATPYLGITPKTPAYPDPGYLMPAAWIFDPTNGKQVNTATPGLVALTSWYGQSLMDTQWKFGLYQPAHNAIVNKQEVLPYYKHPGREQKHQHEVLPLGPNPDATTDFWSGSCLIGGIFNNSNSAVIYSMYGMPHQLYWGPISLYASASATNAKAAFVCTYAEDTWKATPPYFEDLPYNAGDNNTYPVPPYIVGVSNEYGEGRSVFWTFGYYDLSIAYRNRPTWDTLEWLRDGTVSGSVMQTNGNTPIAHALVTATDSSGNITANYTDNGGGFVLHGLRPGNALITVIANGYSTNLSQPAAIIGGGITPIAFYLTQDAAMATLWGYVTLRGIDSVGATVTATEVNGGGQVYHRNGVKWLFIYLALRGV